MKNIGGKQMRRFLDCIGPMLIAVGLWLAGNMLMTTTPARGQEVTGPNGYGCVVYNSPVQTGQCIFSVNQRACVGSCSFTVYTTRTCSAYVVNGETFACQTVQSQPEGTTIQHYSGSCQSLPQNLPNYPPPCGCVQGNLQSTSYSDGPICAWPT